LIADVDDADDEYDEYDDCDNFRDYNAHTLAEIDRVEQEALAIGEYIWFFYVKCSLIHFSAGSSTLQQLTTLPVPSDTPLETSSLSKLPVGGAEHTGSLPWSHETPLANIDPRLLALGTDATPAHSGVTTEPPGSFHGCRDNMCEGGHLLQTHPAHVNTTTSGASQQAGHVMPDNMEDEQARLKELHEAAMRSQSREFAHYHC
jgi:hypothetical protein